MALTDLVAADLRSDEGWRESVYQDHLGFWTIGYGFLVDARKQGRIPKEVADYWLAHEIDRVDTRLSNALPWYESAPEPIQRALMNMGYQLGVSGLLRFRRTLSLIEAGKYEDAADEALRSRWADQTPNRAKRVTDLIRSAA